MKRLRKLPPVSEGILHRHVAKFLDTVLRPPVTWTTIPAGGGGRVRGAQLKQMGLKRGWPDILIIAPGPNVVGIELKREDGDQSPEQYGIELAFKDCQCWYVLCRSVAEVERALRFTKVLPSSQQGRAG